MDSGNARRQVDYRAVVASVFAGCLWATQIRGDYDEVLVVRWGLADAHGGWFKQIKSKYWCTTATDMLKCI